MTIRVRWMARSALVLALAELLVGAGCVTALRPVGPYYPAPLPLKLQTAVAVDKDGNRILAGSFDRQFLIAGTKLTSAGETDIFVAKVDAAGVAVFPPQRFGGVGEDAATGVAVDQDGSIVIAGTFQGQATFGARSVVAEVRHPRQFAVFVAKLDPAGKLLWIKQVGFANVPTQVSVAVGPDHNIFVGASTVGTVGREGADARLEGESISLALLDREGSTANVPQPTIPAMVVAVTCGHSPCQEGGRLDPTCDPCVKTICLPQNDPFCCGSKWDYQCTQEVWSMCWQRCDCNLCQVGARIHRWACDCVSRICKPGVDSFCCETEWDSQCVGDVASTCSDVSCNQF